MNSEMTEKEKAIEFSLMVKSPNFGINQIWAQVSILLLTIEGYNNY